MPSEQAIENRRARDRIKRRKWRAARKAEKMAALVKTDCSKTSAAYRQIRFGIAPEMTKGEMRAMLAEAVRNTAEVFA